MIRGKVRINLTPEIVLQKVSDYDIYHFFMGHRDWDLNKVTNSIFHKDLNPSFLIGNKNGYLYHVDFSLPDFRGGCFDFVMQLYNVNLNDALEIIDKEMHLGIVPEHGKEDYKRIVNQYKQPEETLGKRYSVIQVVTRKFTKEELDYQSRYYQNLDDLRENHIYSIEKAYLNRQLFPIKDNEIRFGYLYGSFWKLYFPHREKRRKWISNVPVATAYGLENLRKDKNSLILDSLKDYMVCRKVYKYCAGLQNESLAAISKETGEYINANSKKVFLGFDSDNAGKAASHIITKLFNWNHINTPDRLLPLTKDWAGWAERENLENIEEHFKIKGLIE